MLSPSSLPWFGEGRTTIRGGYQITYQGGGRFGTVSGVLGATPGSQPDGQLYSAERVSGSDEPEHGSDSVVPLTSRRNRCSLDVHGGTTERNLSIYDPNYTSPYVQNLTLSVTRSVNRNVTVDLRYVGTLSRKTYTTRT